MPIYLPRSASPFLSPRYARSGSRSLAFLWFDFRSTGVQQGGRSEDGGLKSANEYEAAGPSGHAPFSFSNEHGPGTREISQAVDAADDLWGGTQQQPMDCDEREEDEILKLRSRPLRKYLMDNVIPTLTQGLIQTCKLKPVDPIEHLAAFLFEACEQQEQA